MRRSKAHSLFVLGALCAAACSAHDDDPPPGYSSGLDTNAGLSGLTPVQKQTICTSQAAFVRTRVDTTALTRFWCAFTPGVFMAPNDAACETAMNACIESFS